MSVMEMSHRGKVFDGIIKEAEADLRDLLSIPDNYKVLFLQGGAWTQFSAVPMNMMKNKRPPTSSPDSGQRKPGRKQRKYGDAMAVAPPRTRLSLISRIAPICRSLRMLTMYTSARTIPSTVQKFHELPDTKGHDLVADVSSCFLSEPVDVSKYAVMYGGVQKNIGPAGVVIAIIREDLIRDDVVPGTPTMLKWKTQADNDSLFNTPPAYGIYICGKVFKWIKKMGGLEVMKERNEKKAKLLYDYLDESKLFKGTVRKEDRSLMNVPFVIGDKELEAQFVKEAEAEGLVSLKGHRSVGGMRASIYNAMPYEGVEKLVAFMKDFEAKHPAE